MKKYKEVVIEKKDLIVDDMEELPFIKKNKTLEKETKNEWENDSDVQDFLIMIYKQAKGGSNYGI